MTAWRLLLTRPADDCAAMAAELGAAGVHVSCLPLLEIEPLTLNPEQLAPVQQLASYSAVIVVSKPAARLLLPDLAQLPQGPAWFSVGAATASLLEQRGVAAHWPAQGDDSEALLALPALQAATQGPGARVLIVRGEGGRETLAETLRGAGVTVDYLQLYRRRLPAYARGRLPALVQAERLNALVVSSGQGFEHLCQLAGEEDGLWLRRLPLFVPSQRVAEMAIAAGSENVINCGGASALALREALHQHAAPEAR